MPLSYQRKSKWKMAWFRLKAKKRPGSTRLKCWHACIPNHSPFYDFTLKQTNEMLCTRGADRVCAHFDWSKPRTAFIRGLFLPLHHSCKRHIWVQTSVLKELRNLVLGGSRNTMEGAQLGQSLNKVSVLTIQGSYPDSCHCKVLEKTSCNEWNELCAKKKKDTSGPSQQRYKKSGTHTELSTVRTLLTPHITCVLCGSGKLK